MSFTSINDPEFWERCPPAVKHLQDDFRTVRGKGSDMAYVLLGELDEDPSSIGCMHLAAGEVIPRHRHDCYRVEIVLGGSLEVPDGRTLRVGDMMISEPGEPYGPHVAGADGCTTFEIMGKHSSVVHPYLETSEGPIPFDITTEEGHREYRAAATKLRATQAETARVRDTGASK
jgi:hypothetical protein